MKFKKNKDDDDLSDDEDLSDEEGSESNKSLSQEKEETKLN